MKSVLIVLAAAAIAAGISAQPFTCYPRMRDQPSIKPFERRMPEMPKQVIPFSGRPVLAASASQAAGIPNPVQPTSRAITLGRIYYSYYCQMCHGGDGRGDGPVGRSYIPKPADLTSARVQSRSDGSLAWAMVRGEGHDPVLESTVPVERRWYLAHFLRTLVRRRG